MVFCHSITMEHESSFPFAFMIQWDGVIIMFQRKKVHVENAMQYYVTRENGTEPPFQNAYWDNKKPGIYVDVYDGTPLFASFDQFDAGCGWPSFTKPLSTQEIKVQEDYSHGMSRTEVRSQSSDAHLGHVFDDGPEEQGGLRYCINSASLRFIPYSELDEQGYGAYRHFFKIEEVHRK